MVNLSRELLNVQCILVQFHQMLQFVQCMIPILLEVTIQDCHPLSLSLFHNIFHIPSTKEGLLNLNKFFLFAADVPLLA